MIDRQAASTVSHPSPFPLPQPWPLLPPPIWAQVPALPPGASWHLGSGRVGMCLPPGWLLSVQVPRVLSCLASVCMPMCMRHHPIRLHLAQVKGDRVRDRNRTHWILLQASSESSPARGHSLGWPWACPVWHPGRKGCRDSSSITAYEDTSVTGVLPISLVAAPLWEWGLVSDSGPENSGCHRCDCFCSEGKVTAKTSFQREFRVAREDLHSPQFWLLMDIHTSGPCHPTRGALVPGDRVGGVRGSLPADAEVLPEGCGREAAEISLLSGAVETLKKQL